MKNFLFIRHGESLLNRQRCVQGQLDSKLTEKGIKQALSVADQLKNVNVKRIISSPLLRTRETAEIIAGELNIQVIYENEIREIFMGKWEGKPFQELIDKDREMFRSFIDKPAKTIIPEAEKLELFQKRITRWLDKMLQSNEERHIIVSHAGVINIILCTVLGQHMNSLWHFKNDNCSICEITFNGSAKRVLRINDISHLDKELTNSFKIAENLNA